MLADLVPRILGNMVDTTAGRISRVFFTVSGRTMVLLHGFIKKTRTTPAKELGLANRRMKEYVSNE